MAAVEPLVSSTIWDDIFGILRTARVAAMTTGPRRPYRWTRTLSRSTLNGADANSVWNPVSHHLGQRLETFFFLFSLLKIETNGTRFPTKTTDNEILLPNKTFYSNSVVMYSFFKIKITSSNSYKDIKIFKGPWCRNFFRSLSIRAVSTLKYPLRHTTGVGAAQCN